MQNQILVIDFQRIWHLILQVGSIAGLVSLAYTISQNRKKKASFDFKFRGSSRELFKKGEHEYCRFFYDGIVKNKSLEPNSIIATNLVVWGDKKRSKTLSFGHNPILVKDIAKSKEVKLPIKFKAKEARHFSIKFEIALTGSHDEKLVKEFEPLKKSPFVALPKYDYRLIFEDVSGNLFDDTGQLRSKKEIDLWWTLPNTFNKLKEGNFIPFIQHYVRLQTARILFRIRRIFFHLGL